MANKIYRVSFQGLNTEGKELFCRCRYFSDPELARKALEDYTAEFQETLAGFLYPSRVSLYVHLVVRELIPNSGEYKYKKSAIYSCCEKCETTIYKENPVFNPIYE